MQHCGKRISSETPYVETSITIIGRQSEMPQGVAHYWRQQLGEAADLINTWNDSGYCCRPPDQGEHWEMFCWDCAVKSGIVW